MQDSDKLIAEFVDHYMEKVFYFCLKKTGNSYEAEDLSSDIALCIFSELRRGVIPVNVPAWVWQIARNRYSKWAESKHRRAEVVSGADIADLELADDGSIEHDYVRKEDLSLLRRELAFISSDYRDIVVAHYIDDRSIKEIASSLNLPKGTVTSKLFRARSILKEGMSMAREFGVRSYKPEEISFINSCSSFGDNGQPWSILKHLLYKNIFLEVYDHPETAEELSLQLGIALPYIEDELNFLTEQTFLVAHDGKYETSFPIISGAAQEKINKTITSAVGEITDLLEKLIDVFTAACERTGCHYYGTFQSYDDAKWTLLMRAFDWLMSESSSGGNYAYTKRPNNGNWDIVGYQNVDVDEPPFVGLHGYIGEVGERVAVSFQQFKFQYAGIAEKTPDFLTYEEALTLKMVAEGKWKVCEEHVIRKLLHCGYIRKDEIGFVPCIVVFDGSGADQYRTKFNEEEKTTIRETANKIRRHFSELNEYTRAVIRDDLPKSFRSNDHFCEFACRNSGVDRRHVLARAIEHGWLNYSDKTSRVIGAYLYRQGILARTGSSVRAF